MFLFDCPASHHPSIAGNPFIRWVLAYSGNLIQQGDFIFSQKKLKVPNKMSEGGRYIIAEKQILVKGSWHADQ